MTDRLLDPRSNGRRPWPHGMVAPCEPQAVNNSAAMTLANQARACRVIIPKTGTLVDLYCFIATTGGNVLGAVYDTGEAATTQGGVPSALRTKLWEGASVAAAADSWRKLGDPNLAVRAGQALDFAVMADGTVATIARASLLTNFGILPTGFFPVFGGATPKLSWAYNAAGFTYPATIADGSLLSSGTLPFLIARVV